MGDPLGAVTTMHKFLKLHEEEMFEDLINYTGNVSLFNSGITAGITPTAFRDRQH